MLYFNVNNSSEKEKILNLLKENNVSCNNVKQIQLILNRNNINFASIVKFEDGSLEIINNNDYILLGPLGGISETRGKYDKYNCFDRDLDEFYSVLQHDINYIIGGNVNVINLGKNSKNKK